MDTVLTFISENPTLLTVIMLAIILAVIIGLYVTGKQDKAKAIIYQLVLEAEATFIDETGAGYDKYQQVVDKLYDAMPPMFKLFISEEQIDIWIEEAVDKLKEVTK